RPRRHLPPSPTRRSSDLASFAATERQAKLLEARLAKDPDVEFFTTYIGAGTPIFYLSIPAELPDPGFAQFVIKTAGSEPRERLRSEEHTSELQSRFDLVC